jgi:hypothetical protein
MVFVCNRSTSLLSCYKVLTVTRWPNIFSRYSATVYSISILWCSGGAGLCQISVKSKCRPNKHLMQSGVISLSVPMQVHGCIRYDRSRIEIDQQIEPGRPQPSTVRLWMTVTVNFNFPLPCCRLPGPGPR